MRQAAPNRESILLGVRPRAETEIVAREHLRGGLRPIDLLQRHDVGAQLRRVVAQRGVVARAAGFALRDGARQRAIVANSWATRSSEVMDLALNSNP